MIKCYVMKKISESAKKSAYSTASACMRPSTGGICPESLFPCNDLQI
jgi:hypothetical protein